MPNENKYTTKEEKECVFISLLDTKMFIDKLVEEYKKKPKTKK